MSLSIPQALFWLARYSEAAAACEAAAARAQHSADTPAAAAALLRDITSLRTEIARCAAAPRTPGGGGLQAAVKSELYNGGAAAAAKTGESQVPAAAADALRQLLAPRAVPPAAKLAPLIQEVDVRPTSDAPPVSATCYPATAAAAGPKQAAAVANEKMLGEGHALQDVRPYCDKNESCRDAPPCAVIECCDLDEMD